jgi:hypothetical protein
MRATPTRAASPSPVRFWRSIAQLATAARLGQRSPYARISAGLTQVLSKPRQRFQIITRPAGSSYGSGASTTASARLKIAVLAAIPSASVPAASAVKPGARSRWRTAWRRSSGTGPRPLPR